MRKVAWSNGHSHSVISVRHPSERYSPHGVELRDIWAPKPGREEGYAKRVMIERKAGTVRDKSRKAIVQSGYVTSGWAKQTKGGVSHVSRKVANQALRKLVIG